MRVKKWFEAQISGILPDVFSYISHFVCLSNFNYTGRLLNFTSKLYDYLFTLLMTNYADNCGLLTCRQMSRQVLLW